MFTYSAAYLVALIVFFAADMVWLGSLVGRVYRPALGDVLAPSVNLPPAIAFYLVYPAGLVIFAVKGAIQIGSIASAFGYGALFGFFAYSTYDLSNYATLRNWPLHLTLIDIGWGTLLSGTAAAAAFYAASRIAA